jgi:hypothetical protein
VSRLGGPRRAQYDRGWDVRAFRIIGVLAAIALASAAVTSSASAAAKKLDLFYNIFIAGNPYEQQVQLGAHFSTGPATAVKLDASKGGELSCTGLSGGAGEVITNDAPKDEILANIGLYANPQLCTSTVPLATEALVSFQFAYETAIYLSSKLKAEVIAPAGHPHLLQISFAGGTNCGYEATKLKATLSLEALVLTFKKQKFKLVLLGSSAACPKTMSFSAVYAAPVVNVYNNPLYGRLN